MSILGRGVPNRPIVIRNDLADPLVLTTAAPVVVVEPPDPCWLVTHPVVISRSSLEDATDFDSPTRIIVVTSQPDRRYNGGFSYNERSTLQDPPVLTTPSPVVESSSSQLYFNKGFNLVSSAPAISVAAPSSSTPGPIIAGVRNAGQWFNVNPAKVIDNVQLGIPTQNSPDPFVITSQPSRLYIGRPAIIIDNVQLGGAATFVRPICYSGTVAGENTFVGSVVEDLILGGSIVDQNTFTGTIVDENTFTGTMNGWCMQEVDITAAEFNDESWDFAISSGSPPAAFNITGLTIEVYFKVAAGDADTAPTTVKLTTPTDIVITDGPNGKGTVTLPSADLQPGDTYGFYRLDIMQSGKRHTALYGKVGVTLL